MDNLYIYEQARAVPADAKKPIGAGRLAGFTDINPMWRIKKLTEIFGPCGIGWWYTIDNKWKEEAPNGEVKAFVDITLFYKNSETGVSHGIPGTGGSSFLAKEKNGPYVSDECYKMALTDAISVAAKALGVAADVYYAKDRTKYTPLSEKPVRKEPEKLEFPAQGYMDEEKMKDLLELAKALGYSDRKLALAIQKKFSKKPNELTEEEYHEIVQLMTGRIAEGKADESKETNE